MRQEMEREKITSFGHSLRLAQRGLGWSQKNDMQCCGVTIAQCHALLEIGEHGNISIVELAGILGVDTSTLSRTVDNMFKTGFVDRVLNPNDRRYVTLSLTEKGNSLFTTIQKSFHTYLTELFEHIPEEKHTDVIECLNILSAAIEKCNKEFSCCNNSPTEH
jgi:DNA-binding MarR family transcriptional regulator